MTRGLTGITAALLILAFAATPAFAQKVSEDEKNLCIEAINDLTDGKPPADAVTLCGEGKIEAAMEKAMAAQGG